MFHCVTCCSLPSLLTALRAYRYSPLRKVRVLSSQAFIYQLENSQPTRKNPHTKCV